MIFVVDELGVSISRNTQVLPDRGYSMNFQLGLFSSKINEMYDVFEQSLSKGSH